MRFVDEYRDGEAVRRAAAAIASIQTRPWTLMEICGGQTHSILKFGLDQLLPETLTLVHGPGCPVCVTVRLLTGWKPSLSTTSPSTSQREAVGTPITAAP